MSLMQHDAPHEPGYWLLNELGENPYTGKRPNSTCKAWGLQILSAA